MQVPVKINAIQPAFPNPKLFTIFPYGINFLPTSTCFSRGIASLLSWQIKSGNTFAAQEQALASSETAEGGTAITEGAREHLEILHCLSQLVLH